MNQSPLVTICVPTYNAESSIRETLNSLVSQSYPNIKIKIFDNCSTDSTLSILSSYTQKYPSIQVLQNEQNIGAEGNFTRCLQEGEGKYTAIFHSDDIYHPEIVAEQVKILESNNSLVAVATHANTIDESGKIIGSRFLPPELRDDDYTSLNKQKFIDLLFKYGNFITCPSVMAHTQVYSEQIKTWNGTKYDTTADLDVWLRLTGLGEMAFCKKALINYRVAEISYSFREKKVRVTEHPIFKILDEIKSTMSLSPKNFEHYNFLRFKDSALISLNCIKSKLKPQTLPTSPFSLSLFKVALSSKWHLKFYCYGLIIWFLSALRRIFI